MKKLLFAPLLIVSGIFAADLWESSWHQGNSIYHLSNKKDSLELACNYEGGSLTLVDSKEDLGNVISLIINNETKITTPTRVRNAEGTSSDHNAWAKLIYELPKAKKLVIETKKKSYTFEPNNSQKELSGITESCLEYTK